MKEITREKIQEVVDKIAKEYEPKKIILFGSYAWGSPTSDSDVDLFIIKETEDTRKMARKINRFVFPRPFPIDLIVYTPKQVEKQSKIDFFVRNILNKGVFLYDAR